MHHIFFATATEVLFVILVGTSVGLGQMKIYKKPDKQHMVTQRARDDGANKPESQDNYVLETLA